MKVKVTLNGKTADIDIPDEKLEELGLKEKKKPTGYERAEKYGRYFVIAAGGVVYPSMEEHKYADDERYASVNYHNDETLALANSRADTLMRKLRRFAAENGGIPSVEDWRDKRTFRKWFLFYDFINTKDLRVDYSTHWRLPGVVYFKSEEACKRAIEEFKDELTWYFTEYQAMLY